MFINCTNHPYAGWLESEKKAAEKYGEVVDLNFPAIVPDASREDLYNLVTQFADKICGFEPDAVLLMGEFSFTFMLADCLIKKNIKVLTTRTERVAKEVVMPDGKLEKTSIFNFVCFFEYAYYEKDI